MSHPTKKLGTNRHSFGVKIVVDILQHGTKYEKTHNRTTQKTINTANTFIRFDCIHE
jgi:hypothetical protein